jgi:hypothetical protein
LLQDFPEETAAIEQINAVSAAESALDERSIRLAWIKDRTI